MSRFSYKTLFIIFFFLLIGVIILSKFALPNQKVSAAWWNDMWNYRKAISIANTSGSNLTDFQVSISVGTSALIASGKMQSDCDDIRITDINGNLLPYWIEENNPGCNAVADTKIWIKASSLPTSGAIVYIYYGNPSATSAQNGTNVFEFFDDFNDAIKTNNNWTATGTGYTVTGGNLYHSTTLEPSNNFATYTINDSSGFTNGIVESRMKPASCGSSYGKGIIARYSNDNNEYIAGLEAWTGNYTHIGRRVSGTWTNIDQDPLACSTSTWYQFKWTLNGNNQLLSVNDIASSGVDSSFSSGKIGVHVDNRETPTGAYWDYIFVHKYASADPTPTLQSEEIGTAPIAYWKFDEGIGTTAYDSTSNQNNGTISGATWTDESQCISGKCLNFNGTNDYLNNINTSLPNVGSNANLTISAWIKPTNTTGSIFTKGQSGNCFNYGLKISGGNLLARNSSSDYNLGGNITTGNWQYIAIVYTSSGAQGYINGKSINSNGSAITSNCTSNQWVIGARAYNDLSTEQFNGFIDEVKIYPYARTAAQIKLDYNAGKAHAGSSEGTSTSLGSNKNNGDLSDGLVGYWKMDEGVGTSIADSSGIGYTATFGTGDSAPTWSSGKFGIGISFDGSNDYINFGNPNLSSLTNSSISFWRKAVNTSAWLLFQGQTTSYYILATSGTGAFYHANIGSTTKIYIDGNLATTPLTDNNWHHYVITGVNLSTWTNLNLSNYPNFHYNGQIDEIRLYNRSLSPSEVSDLYNYAPGPVGYWDFNEASGTIANDKSGNGKDLTTYNSPSWSQGKIGSALGFNGLNQYARRTSESSFQRVNGQEISVSVWIYPKRLGGQYQDIVANRSGSGLNWLIYQHTTDGSIQFHGSAQNKSTYIPPLNQWTHIEATVDTAGNYKLYANGQIVQSLTGYTFDTSGITELTVGNFGSTEYYLGKIDEVKIYNYARTQKQIIEDMGGGTPATSSKSMVGYWKFDEGYGIMVNNWGNGGVGLNGVFGTGNSAPTWTNDGKFGKALNFNNTYSYASFNTTSFNNSTQFAASAWIKSNDTSQNQTILSANGPIFLRISGGKFRVGVYTNNSTWTFVNGSIPLNNNIWYHLALVYDGVNLKSYVNGVLDINTPTTGNLVAFAPFYIGYPVPGGENYPFNGLIDELKIYNYALTSEEIKQDYNQGSATSFGQTTQTIGATTTSLDYCIPGDTSFCASPIAEYKMDEGVGTSAFDTSGNNNSAALENSPTWVQGKIGSAIQLNGTNQRGTTGGNINGTNITIESWVYRTSATVNQGIVRKDPVYALTLYNNTIQVAPGNNWAFYDSGLSLPLNVWTHIVFTYDGITMKIYKNGQLGWSTGLVGALPNNANPTYIGYDANGWWFGGKMDQIRIYNYARTPAQVAYDYNKGGPVGWWKFDECQGNIAYDWSGIGNTGVIIIGASGTQNSLGTCQVGTSAAWTNGATGKTNSSLNFDGVDDYVQINDNPSLNPTTGISVSAWIKWNTNNAQWEWLVAKNIDSSATNGYMLVKHANTDTIGFVIDGIHATIPRTSFTAGNWYHLVGTANAGGTANLYVNGSLTKSTSGVPNPITHYASSLGINKSFYYASPAIFQGQIDDVRIYNYALTSEQVKILYNGGSVSFN